MSFEYRTAAGGKDRADADSLLAGVGVSQPVGPRTWLDLAVLYNFSYPNDVSQSPCDSRWIYRFGVTVGL